MLRQEGRDVSSRPVVARSQVDLVRLHIQRDVRRADAVRELDVRERRRGTDRGALAQKHLEGSAGGTVVQHAVDAVGRIFGRIRPIERQLAARVGRAEIRDLVLNGGRAGNRTAIGGVGDFEVDGVALRVAQAVRARKRVERETAAEAGNLAIRRTNVEQAIRELRIPDTDLQSAFTVAVAFDLEVGAVTEIGVVVKDRVVGSVFREVPHVQVGEAVAVDVRIVELDQRRVVVRGDQRRRRAVVVHAFVHHGRRRRRSGLELDVRETRLESDRRALTEEHLVGPTDAGVVQDAPQAVRRIFGRVCLVERQRAARVMRAQVVDVVDNRPRATRVQRARFVGDP